MPLRCARYRQLSPTAPATGKRLPSLSTYTMLTLPSRPRRRQRRSGRGREGRGGVGRYMSSGSTSRGAPCPWPWPWPWPWPLAARPATRTDHQRLPAVQQRQVTQRRAPVQCSHRRAAARCSGGAHRSAGVAAAARPPNSGAARATGAPSSPRKAAIPPPPTPGPRASAPALPPTVSRSNSAHMNNPAGRQHARARHANTAALAVAAAERQQSEGSARSSRETTPIKSFLLRRRNRTSDRTGNNRSRTF